MQADAIASLFIAVMIVPRAIGLLREFMAVLTESAPTGVHGSEIREHLRGADGVVDVHDVHLWAAHARSAGVQRARRRGGGGPDRRPGVSRILASLQTCLADHFDVEHSTFQLEPAGHVEHDAQHA